MITKGTPAGAPGEAPKSAETTAKAVPTNPKQRYSQAHETANVLLDAEKNREIKRLREVIKDAKKVVVKMFRKKRIKLHTNRGEVEMKTMEYILKYPFIEFEEDWIADIRAIKETGEEKTKKIVEISEKYGSYKPNKTGTGKINETVLITEAYLDKMSKEEGWITPAVLAEMSNSLSAKASIISELLAETKNRDILDALRWSLGISKTAMVEAKEKALTTLKKEVEQYPNGELIDAIWMILAFSEKDVRMEIARHYKATNPDQLDAFLRDGNARGVYSPDEMKDLGMGFKQGEEAKLADLFRSAHDFTEKEKEMLSKSHGSTNRAADLMTGENFLVLLGYAASGLTVLANIGVGISTMIRDKDYTPERAVRIVANKNVIGGLLGWKVLDHIRSGKKGGQTLAGKAKRENLARMQAIQALSVEKRGNPLWKEWDGFFSSADHSGSKAFCDFVGANKTKKGEFPEKKFTAKRFREYLKEQSTAEKPANEDLDYADLLRKFDGTLGNSDSKSIRSLAKVFDYFKIDGAQAETNYGKAMKAVATV